MKRACSIIVILAMILVYAIPFASADNAPLEPEAPFSDVTNHWAKDEIDHWTKRGVISGLPDGTFKPDQQISRAEFIMLINRVFGFNEKADVQFSDVSEGKWYSAAIKSAAAAGYVQGYPDGTFKPDQAVTRQEAAYILATLFKLEPEGDLSVFKDGAQTAGFAEQALASMAANGFISGYADGTVQPSKGMTRSKFVSVLDRMVGGFNEAASLVTSHAVISKSDVELKASHIQGNVYISAGVGEGNAVLNGIQVDGTVYVNAGGSNSIHMIDSTLNHIVVNKKGGKVRVVLDGRTSAKTITVESTADLEIAEDVVVDALTIEQMAENTSIQVKGQIGLLDNRAEGVKVNGQTIQAGSDYAVENGQISQDGTSIPGIPAGGGTGGSGGGSDNGGDNSDVPEQVGDWSLVWNDEFNGSEIDRTKWTFDLTNGIENPGWGNNELEYYTDRPENAKVQDGELVITALQEDYEGFGYTSARMKTKGLASWTYGRFEARAKFPEGRGLWPAIWMLPENNEYGVWAASGEIDIVEGWGSRPNEIVGTIHSGETWPKNNYTGKTIQIDPPATAWHTYALEWEPGELRWYIDGQLFHTENNWYSKGLNQPLNYAYPAPFDKAFHLLVNLAVGGNFDGDPDESTVFPAELRVDYIRVYELTGRPYREPVKPEVPKEPIPADARQPLADGNLVYNPQFDQTVEGETGIEGVPNTSYWNLLHVADFGGDAYVTIDAMAGRNYAKVNITQPGNQTYSVQLVQHVPIVKGRWYELNFDAKTDTSRTIQVKVGADADRGYETYATSDPYKLTHEVQNYKLLFQMSQETNLNTRLEFNLGLNASPVWIGNVQLKEVEEPSVDVNAAHSPAGDGNHVYNGTFDQGEMDRLTYWQLNTAGASAASMSVDEAARELKVHVENGGASIQDTTVFQNGIQLLQGQTYKLSFQARADQPREIGMELRDQNGTASFFNAVKTIGASMNTYEFQFTMPSPNQDLSQLAFYVGGNGGDVYLDNVQLIRTSSYVDPNIEWFPLKNGRFDDGMQSWQFVLPEGGAGSANVNENGELAIQVDAPGSQPYSVLLFQDALDLYKGAKYRLSFEARSTIDREIEVTIEDASYTRYFDQNVVLTSEMQKYTFEMEMPGDISSSLKFSLGQLPGAQANHQIIVDNIVLEVQGARDAASMLQNGSFEQGMNGWVSHVADYAGAVGTVTAENGQMKAHIGYEGQEFWHAHVKQEGLQLKGGKRYLLTFDAASTAPRSIVAKVENTANNAPVGNGAEKAFGINQELSTYEMVLSVTDDVYANVVFGFGGGIDSQPQVGEAHTITLDQVNFIELEDAAPAPSAQPLMNGAFDTDLNGWKEYKGDGSNAQFSVENGELKADFTGYDGWFLWSTQCFQENVQIEPGKAYRISFDMRSTADKPIMVKIENGSAVNLEQTVTLNESTQHFEFEFTGAGDDDAATLFFFMGSNNVAGENFVPHTVYLDNVVLEEVQP
ncbi:carbohydrate binding domain-containing protein [Marinicrinis lubricantis]|uniref:Carbohydrate binding domain-containing protein n=1 Tax=Marinicrinis lubricantis TaxID=2086470 RepID=A0ABW1INR0_9BACL